MDKVIVVLVAIAAIVGLSFLFSYPLMLLWNGCLVPAVTVTSEVSWLQMWGLSILIGLLFKPSVTSSK